MSTQASHLLTKKEWEQLHKSKLKDVPARERAARYRQYLESTRAEGPKLRAPLTHSKTDVVKTGKSNRAMASTMAQLLDSPYFKAMMDPFHAPPAPLPDLACNKTTSFSTTTRFTLAPDTNGNAVVFVRPGVDLVYAASGPQSDAGITWAGPGGVAAGLGDLPSILYNAGAFNANGNLWSTANNENSYSCQELHDQDRANAIKELYASTRVTACAVSLRPIGPPLERGGMIVAAPWKGDYGAPSVWNAGLALGATRAAGGLQANVSAGVSYQNVAALEGAVEVSAVDGITQHWVPTGIEAAAEFRPTSYRPRTICQEALNVLRNDPTNSPVTEVTLAEAITPAAVCPSSEYRSFYDMFFGLNPTVHFTTFNTTYTTGPYSWSSTYGGAPGPSGYASDADMVADANGFMIRREEAFLLTAMGSGDCGLIVVATGLPKAIATFDPATGLSTVASQDLFEVEIITHFEAITDQRSFSVPGMSAARVALQHPVTAHVALAGAAMAPVAHPGAHNSAGHAEVGRWINDAALKVAEVAGTGKKIVDGVKAVASSGAWADIAEVASALFAFL